MSLCLNFYKVLTKVLSVRLKSMLYHLINSAQSAFIQGRDVAHNISLAQEICDELNYGSHSKAFYAKIVLYKAFDSVNGEALIFILI